MFRLSYGVSNVFRRVMQQPPIVPIIHTRDKLLIPERPSRHAVCPPPKIQQLEPVHRALRPGEKLLPPHQAVGIPHSGYALHSAEVEYKRMGIQTVSIGHDPNVHDVHVEGATPAKSYTNITGILRGVQNWNKENPDRQIVAIDPRYGYSSEDPKAAQAVSDAGLIWVGPDVPSMELGDKDTFRQTLLRAGVCCSWY